MPFQSSENLRAALAYAGQLEWSVFPLAPRGKEPVGYLVPHGVLEATKDVARIHEWWARSPRASVGIAMGASGLVALDVDQHGTDGEESLRRLEADHEPLPETVVGLTGGGGRHLVYRAPTDVKLRQVPLGPGVDVRCGAGYIVAPPSIHPSGRAYAWDAAHHPLDLEPARLPEWVIEYLREDRRKDQRGEGSALASVIGRAFARAGLVAREIDDRRVAVVCPWSSEHTTGRPGDTSTVVFAPRAGSVLGGFFCAHEHCRHRTVRDVLAMLHVDEHASARHRAAARLWDAR
jgi:hypothetical protein